MTKDVFSKLTLHGKQYAETARVNMIKQQIRTWDVLDTNILALFEKVDRANYVPHRYKELAYADIHIPLTHGQTMMTPKEEARVLQDLKITATDRVLVMGIESGYLLNLLSRVSRQIYYLNNDIHSFEIVEKKVEEYRLPNVNFLTGNLKAGWQEHSPYDVILLTGSLPFIPQALKNAIDLSGRLFVVVGKPPVMEAMIVTRVSENTWNERKVFETFRPRMLDVKEPDQFVF